MFCTHRLECAPYDRPTDAEAREISSIATMCARKPRPEPPNSSGTVTPSRPMSPNLRQRSSGKTFSRSMRSARGAISFSAKAWTLSRRRSRSSPRENGRMRATPGGYGEKASHRNAPAVPIHGATQQSDRRQGGDTVVDADQQEALAVHQAHGLGGRGDAQRGADEQG